MSCCIHCTRLSGAAVAESTPKWSVSVHDFNCTGSALFEPIPAKGDRKSVMRYWWDSGHFKPVLGGIVLEQILLGSGDSPLLKGWRIDPAIPQEHHAICRAERIKYGHQVEKP
jgi:hypothetical protein